MKRLPSAFDHPGKGPSMPLKTRHEMGKLSSTIITVDTKPRLEALTSLDDCRRRNEEVCLLNNAQRNRKR
jgi:hypothetical protein